MDKKVLILIGGITQHPYIKSDVDQSNFDKSPYDVVVQFYYDHILDNRYKKLDCYKYLPFLDKHGDWWQFAFHPATREKIRHHLEVMIKEYQAMNYEIHVLAHSLGSWILCGTDCVVDSVISMGSPISSKSWVVRNIVKQELKSRINDYMHMRCSTMDYMYSKNDFVAGHNPDYTFLKNFNSHKLNIWYSTEGDHSAQNYLNWYAKIKS